MSIKFCDQCSSLLAKQYTANGQILFVCRCGIILPGASEDTVMFSEFPNIGQIAENKAFLINAIEDPARNIVMKDCPQCKINYLVSARIDIGTVIYLCTCGFQSSHENYMAKV